MTEEVVAGKPDMQTVKVVLKPKNKEKEQKLAPQ